MFSALSLLIGDLKQAAKERSLFDVMGEAFAKLVDGWDFVDELRDWQRSVWHGWLPWAC
jgi:hypothetical protein